MSHPLGRYLLRVSAPDPRSSSIRPHLLNLLVCLQRFSTCPSPSRSGFTDRSGELSHWELWLVQLMASSASGLSGHPVDDDECQTHDHEEESQRCKAGGLQESRVRTQRLCRDLKRFTHNMKKKKRRTNWYLNFRSGFKRLLLIRNNPDVEDSREDEDEAGGRRGSCRKQRCTRK